MKFSYLTDEMLKSKFILLGCNIEKDAVVTRKVEENQLVFEFQKRKLGRKPKNETSQSNTVLSFSEHQLNMIFIREIRKMKLIAIEKISNTIVTKRKYVRKRQAELC